MSLSIAAARPVAAEEWTETSVDDFAGGTLSDVVVRADGGLELASVTPWQKAGRVLPVGTAGSADSTWARNPFVLKESDGTYKMWYHGFDGTRHRILLATSGDGLDWTKEGVVLDLFESQSGLFVRKDETYHMWFKGGSSLVGDIYHATSPDGRAWTLDGIALSRGPSGAWDSANLNNPWIVRVGDTNYMYYSGTEGFTERIGLAASTVDTGFVRVSSSPVLGLGAPGEWDSGIVRVPAVVTGTSWVMYYAGAGGGLFSIGTATSEDGIVWIRSSGNPILRPDPSPSWDSAGLVGGAILEDSGGSHFYYTGSDGVRLQIGLAMKNPRFLPSGQYLSRVFDSRTYGTIWTSMDWTATGTDATTLAIFVRVGNRASPDGSWTDWRPIGAPGSDVLLSFLRFRYVQYRADFGTSDTAESPVLERVTLGYVPGRGPPA
jgi:predicted GH43/DUF377 family glycosyl hydrolase